ncbi:uncharacterized protein BJX67DRAFT_198043 [Aspergillus lucknowensis]|uniref:NAD(P)-binding domain-containing protein n=1 Tax=Aspergillus lucknowensis TaxID=176173 RepID=A0ABR4LK89_9EURO
MKIILTGTTGFVGTEVLAQVLENPSITSIIVLSRKPLPEPVTKNPKVTVKILDDFLHYPESLLQELQGAEACVWALGQIGGTDMDMYRRINVDYTMAGVMAFSNLSPSSGKPFRFIYCSGIAATRDQEKPLWFLQDIRKIRGQVENELLAHQEEARGKIEVYILRPGFILTKNFTLQSMVYSLGPSIKVNTLAGAMVDLAVEGSADGKNILENGELNRWRK